MAKLRALYSNYHMVTKCFISASLTFLLGAHGHAQKQSKSLTPTKVVSGFTVISAQEEKSKVSCQKIVMPNSMPRVRSQDSFPLCQSYAAATMIQYQYCKRKEIKDCSQVSPDQEVNPLSVHNKLMEDVRGVFSPQKINFKSGYGGAIDGISKTVDSFVHYPESCYPMDQLIAKYGDNSPAKIAQAIAKLNKEIRKAKTEGDICTTCIEGVVKDLQSNVPIDEIKKSILEYHAHNQDNIVNGKNKEVIDTYTGENLLFKLLLDNCKADPISQRRSQAPKFADFPNEDGDKNTESMISKVKEVLGTGNPIAFDGVCLNYENGKCEYTLDKKKHSAGHAVVIHEFVNLCDNDKCDSGCRRAFRIQNSWGKDWQKENNNGLVDAEDLLSYVAYAGDDKRADLKKVDRDDYTGILPSKVRMDKVFSWMY